MCNQKYKNMAKNSCMVYSQIWLHFTKDNCHFFYIFLWVISTLVPKNKFL